MAIFHLSVKMISRGKGKSAVAAAAYRSAEKITNEYDGIIHDYTRKRGVVMTSILLPDNAPIEFYNRSKLWNAVEKIEKAKNAQLAREVEVSIPKELNFAEGYHLVAEFCQKNFVEKGMIADICFHDKGNGNPHAHIMLTVRPFNKDGSWEASRKKNTFLMRMEKKSMTGKSVSTNVNLFPQRTGMTGTMSKSGERAGRICATNILKMQDEKNG